MKKASFAVAITLILGIALIFTGCSSDDTASEIKKDSYTYESELGYSLELPNCYKEEVVVVRGSKGEEFYVKELYEENGMGRLFSVIMVESSELDNIMGGLDNSVAMGITKDSKYTYVAGGPTDVQYELEDQELYQRLFGYYDAIVDSFVLLDTESQLENSSGYILPKSGSEYLNEDDLSELGKQECILALNEIYARHGRMFDDEEIQSHFNNCDWYEPMYLSDEFSESVFNEYEKANIQLIVDYQVDMGYRQAGSQKVSVEQLVNDGFDY